MVFGLLFIFYMVNDFLGSLNGLILKFLGVGSLNFSLSNFDLSTAKLCIKLKGGGNRLKTVGYDVGILHDLVGGGALDAPREQAHYS